MDEHNRTLSEPEGYFFSWGVSEQVVRARKGTFKILAVIGTDEILPGFLFKSLGKNFTSLE